MNKLLGMVKAYKELLAGLLAIGAISAWVAHGIAAGAEKKADKIAEALAAVSTTQAILAQTQQDLAKEQAKQTGKLEGFLATLNLTEAQIAQMQALPREPRVNTAGKILCGQTWLQVWPQLDTIVIYSITRDSCKVSASLVYPRAAK